VRCLLDTCTFLWIIAGSRELSPTAAKIFADPAHEILLSVVSVWEISVKHSLGKLPMPAPPRSISAGAAGDARDSNSTARRTGGVSVAQTSCTASRSVRSDAGLPGHRARLRAVDSRSDHCSIPRQNSVGGGGGVGGGVTGSHGFLCR
jgi:hypothetical protein